jgi:SAM-dependent methyltransferase
MEGTGIETASGYHVHEVRWTSEQVAQFWDALAAEAPPSVYFSVRSGSAIVDRALQEAPLRERRVLDFGCGRGDLLDHLFARGVAAQGLEFSDRSARAVEQRFGAHPLFRGVTVAPTLPSPLAGASVDAVFLVEVVEHLRDEPLAGVLAEVRRVLAPGGIVVATTPNEEELGLEHVRCPECGAGFHRWQHVRSLSAQSISGLFAAHGFESRVAEGLEWGETRSQRLRRLLRPPRKPPHLLYVGAIPA